MSLDAPLDTAVAIETPEHIVFTQRVAGPARRALAYALDLVVCYGALFVLAVVVVLAAAGTGGFAGAIDGVAGLGMGVLLLALFAAQWLYFALWEGLRGRTPGKSAARLRVVTTSGRPIGATAAALRNLLRAADALPTAYVVGLVSMALSSRFQRLGDLVAGTMVVVVPSASRRAPVRVWPPPTDEELAQLGARVALDPEELGAIELFLHRRGSLGAAREQELARLIAEPLSARYDVRAADPVRLLALLHEAARATGRGEGPPSSRTGAPWR